MADPVRAALRVARAHLTDDGLRALAHAMLDAARGETLPAGLLTGLARAAIVAGVRGDLALALLDGAGDHAARLAVDLAAALLEVPAVARATG